MDVSETFVKNSQHFAPVYHLTPKVENHVCKEQDEEVKQLFDIDKFKCLDDFVSALKNYYQCKNTGGPPKKKKKKAIVFKEEKSKQSPHALFLPESVIYIALQKCASDKSFWSVSGFETLLENNFIIHGLEDDLIFDCVLKYNALNSLKVLAKCMISVSEKYIIRILQNIIRRVPLDTIKSLRTRKFSNKCPVEYDIATYLSYTMLLPVNKFSIGEYLKLLTSDESLVLLQFLHYLLYTVAPALYDKSLELRKFDEEITERTVVTWLDALLTAHLISFTSSPELRDLVKDVRKTLAKQAMFYEDIAQLGPYVRHLKEGKNNLEKVIRDYSVETITI